MFEKLICHVCGHDYRDRYSALLGVDKTTKKRTDHNDEIRNLFTLRSYQKRAGGFDLGTGGNGESGCPSLGIQ